MRHSIRLVVLVPRRCLTVMAMASLMGPSLALAADRPRPSATVDVDTSEVPELREYGRKVKELAEKWYPIIVETLPSAGFTAPDHVEIVFEKEKTGVASTSGGRIACAASWFTKHPDDLGAIVHELVHVVQSYRKPAPGWVVEGIADQVRFYQYEPPRARPRPDPERSHYRDSYRTSASFLNWAREKYDPKLVVNLNAACRRGEYRDELFKQATGKTLGELEIEWKESLRAARREKT
jgi:hypothetical protein